MSYIQSLDDANPSGVVDTMSKVYIDDSAILRLSDCVPSAGVYTLQFWTKASSVSEVALETSGLYRHFKITTEWEKHVYTFTASESGSLYFELPVGLFYFYHMKLERGDTASDYTANTARVSATMAVDYQLQRLSDKYVDKLGCDNGFWYIERNTQLVTLDGSESGWEQIINNIYRLPLSYRGEGNTVLPVRCDHFSATDKNFMFMPVNSINVVNISYDDVQTTFLHIRVDTEIASTKTGWCEWLASNPIKVLLPAMPAVTPLANYLQNTLDDIQINDSLTVSMNEAHTHDLRGSVVIKPIVFGAVNDDMSVLINNMSDDEIGFIYEIHCTDHVVNPVIYHTESNQHIRISGSFKRDDVITIDTRQGKKSVTKTYMGASSNIINSFSNTSKWLQLQSGYNHLIQTADSGATNMESVLIYTNEYEGV